MPSFAISKFTVLLEPLWVSAEFLLLSTGPNLDGTRADTIPCIRTATPARCFDSALVTLISSSNDSNGTLCNVPLLSSHACPAALSSNGY